MYIILKGEETYFTDWTECDFKCYPRAVWQVVAFQSDVCLIE